MINLPEKWFKSSKKDKLISFSYENLYLLYQFLSDKAKTKIDKISEKYDEDKIFF
jgi:hypothetical protein